MARSQEPVYTISVAARLVGVRPRTLRLYEEMGLICPRRRATGHRLYSQEEIDRLILIRQLYEIKRINLAGIKFLLELVDRLQIELESLLNLEILKEKEG
ncbi:MAG: MerR family transcriptional regulator [Caldiserica bacterium]|jgi:MerR family transcriptional regulator/heat shock protein HspR|nr:MerR family transcriptional regulator [Caldisericota bacterium]MDH7562570.1 MerR family transcriptional regulator [Caldisericota bacterium]